MTAKQYYHDIDLVNVGQLLNARKQSVTTAQRNTLAASLGAAHIGLFVYDTDLKAGYTWNGSAFDADAVSLQGDVVFKGVINASLALDNAGQPQPVSAVSGYQYVVTTAGTLTLTGVTFSPSASVEVADVVLFTSATQAYVTQRNDSQATTSAMGNVQLATQAESNTGTDANKAVTPSTLQGKIVNDHVVKQYFASVNLAAGTPLTVAHNLNLVDRDAFTVNAMVANSAVSMDVDSVDANSLTLTSLVALNGVRITVAGASAS